MWFDSSNLKIHPPIDVYDLNGYVLPHAGTLYTGNIISHTLRFRPMKHIKYIDLLILEIKLVKRLKMHLMMIMMNF